ncbi:MAG: hypothetical protein J7L73_02760 [Anaerolineales bacterium]|nr:hypothetical protein [Anaerolineales bacterium]
MTERNNQQHSSHNPSSNLSDTPVTRFNRNGQIYLITHETTTEPLTSLLQISQECAEIHHAHQTPRMWGNLMPKSRIPKQINRYGDKK